MTKLPDHHVPFAKEDIMQISVLNIQDLDFENRKIKIKELGLCFRCLNKHLAKDCAKLCYFCKGNHHAVLCKSRIKPNKNVLEPVLHTVEHDENSTHVAVSFVNAESMTTLMQVVRTKINGKEVTIMFDSGSDRSFVTTKCAKDLELDIVSTEYLSYCCFAENGLKEGVKNVFELNIHVERIRLLEMNKICSNMFRSPVPKEVLSNFKGIDFSEDYNLGRSVGIDILIGLDWYWPLIKSQRGPFGDGVVAQETFFRWMFSGVYTQRKKQRELRQEHPRARILFCRSDLKDDTVRRLWELDSIGITDDGSKTQAENEMLKAFNKDRIQFDGTRYTVKLPWKDDKVKTSLINNREQAQKRLTSLKKKLDKDKTLEERYNEALKNMEEGDIIEEVTIEEIGTNGPVFYLPHRPVIKEESTTTKIRPVFDASFRGENGISLNDCMEIGPNLIPDLLGILVRFRRWEFGLTADITKAFLQINVHDSDKDCHRFLWNVDNEIRVMRFNRVIFGNASSPFLLNATVRIHLTKFELTRTVKELRENLYVDDWLTGADSEQEVQRMVRDAEEMMKLGGFPLAKWASNSQQTKNELSKILEGFKDVDVTKVLGLTWMTEDDNFRFHAIPIEKDSLFTKRLILSIAARLFDPMGFLTPFTINLKILFQEVWKIGYEWDDILPVEFQEQMKRWINGLEEVQEWRVPRCIIPTTWTTSGKRELLVFADASEKAYGCCLYLKTTEGELSKVSLVMSKVKVATIKKITLPRLELLAALLTARLLKFVSSALQVGTDISYTCWTDSQIVLNWIKGDAFKWKQFVSHRVQEIQQLTDPARWKHCPGKENPADLLTRGIQARELVESALWLQGPKWLRQTERESVSETLGLEEPESVLEGLERERRIHTILTTAAVKNKITPLMNYERYSDFSKIVRILAWIERFIKKCKHKTEKIYSKDLTAEELESGRISLLRSVQMEFYSDEIKDVQNNKNVKKSSSIQRLSPFIGSHGLMRVRGRLDFASSLLYDEKVPIILPKCHISQLIVKAQHSLMKHAGVNTMISTLRNTYWIISVRTLAKNICRRCINCQRQDSRPCEQITAPLPEDRVKQSPPFSVIGVDHAGPLFCSDMPDTKRYILLFTCAIVRAIHIELVDSLSVDDFILAFKFSARRGRPFIVYSDNAKTFKAACKLLMKEMGHVNLTWKFSAPLSPWWGGWWERLIRSVKTSLRKSLGQSLITRIQLETILQEIEACVNSRPLTYVED